MISHLLLTISRTSSGSGRIFRLQYMQCGLSDTILGTRKCMFCLPRGKRMIWASKRKSSVCSMSSRTGTTFKSRPTRFRPQNQTNLWSSEYWTFWNMMTRTLFWFSTMEAMRDRAQIQVEARYGFRKFLEAKPSVSDLFIEIEITSLSLYLRQGSNRC